MLYLADPAAVRNDRAFFHHNYAIADAVRVGFGVFQRITTPNDDVIADAAVLVNDGILDVAILADAHRNFLVPGNVFDRFIKIITHDDAFGNLRVVTDARANTDDGALDFFGVDDTTIRQNRLVEPGTENFRRRKHAWARVNVFHIVEKIELGHHVGERNIGFKNELMVPMSVQ